MKNYLLTSFNTYDTFKIKNIKKFIDRYKDNIDYLSNNIKKINTGFIYKNDYKKIIYKYYFKNLPDNIKNNVKKLCYLYYLCDLMYSPDINEINFLLYDNDNINDSRKINILFFYLHYQLTTKMLFMNIEESYNDFDYSLFNFDEINKYIDNIDKKDIHKFVDINEGKTLLIQYYGNNIKDIKINESEHPNYEYIQNKIIEDSNNHLNRILKLLRNNFLYHGYIHISELLINSISINILNQKIILAIKDIILILLDFQKTKMKDIVKELNYTLHLNIDDINLKNKEDINFEYEKLQFENNFSMNWDIKVI